MAVKPNMRVVVLSDRRLYRASLALFLHAESGIDVVGSADSDEELREVVDDSVDVIVVDVDNGLDAEAIAGWVRREYSGRCRVIALYTGLDRFERDRLTGSGIDLVARGAGSDALLSTVRGVGLSSPGDGPAATSAPTLAPREMLVLQFLGLGITSSGVARRLGIAPSTVEDHKQRIFAKLGVQNEAHAVAVAVQQGLLLGGSSHAVAGA